MGILQKLNDLNEEQKAGIIENFGSIEQLYQKVFELNAEDYSLHKNKPDDYQALQAKIENTIFSIEDKLDEIGIDGHYVTSEISADHGEIIVNKNIQILDDHLKTQGTSYKIMRKWMKDKFGI